MTSPEEIQQLHGELLSRPGQEEEWPHYFWEDNHGHSEEYCWPCAERVGELLDRFMKIGWMSEEDRAEWQCGRDDGESDTSAPRCHHCGRLLTWSPTGYCIEREVEHFESCSDAVLSKSPPFELESILSACDWEGDQPMNVRVLACVKRFLALTTVEAVQ